VEALAIKLLIPCLMGFALFYLPYRWMIWTRGSNVNYRRIYRYLAKEAHLTAIVVGFFAALLMAWPFIVYWDILQRPDLLSLRFPFPLRLSALFRVLRLFRRLRRVAGALPVAQETAGKPGRGFRRPRRLGRGDPHLADRHRDQRHRHLSRRIATPRCSDAMKELAFLLIGGALFLAATGFDGYNTEQQMNSEDSATVERDHLDLSERLGYAILTKAGYGTVELPPEDELKMAPVMHLVWHSDHPDFRCIDPAVKGGTGNREAIDPFLLLASIVAAEKYNRSAFVRNSEELIARSMLSLSGSVPDFSLGVSQIRPSIIRASVDQAVGDVGLSDREVLDLALSNCTNVVAADRYVRGLIATLDPATPKYQIVAEVSRRYVGAAGDGENGEMYQTAVGGAYRLLETALYGYGSGEDDQMPPAGIPRLHHVSGGRADRAPERRHPAPIGQCRDGHTGLCRSRARAGDYRARNGTAAP
jgi:hypothetical protein